MGKADTSPSKPDVARALLLKGTAFVHLDPRSEDVVVPPWFKNQPQLVLQIGIDMPVPIRDLRVDELGVLATLSFKGSPYTCHVPWESVFALVGDDGKGMMWPASMPSEVAEEVDREVQRMGVLAAAEADARADVAGVARPAPLREEDTALVEDIAQPSRRRRATKQGGKKHQPSAERVPRGKRPLVKPARPVFEVIVGEGGSPAQSRVRSARPSHLKLVK